MVVAMTGKQTLKLFYLSLLINVTHCAVIKLLMSIFLEFGFGIYIRMWKCNVYCILYNWRCSVEPSNRAIWEIAPLRLVST